MELGAKGPDWGHTGEARRQDKADRGSLGQRYSSAQIFYLCLSFSFFFFGGGKGTGWKGDRKTKSKREKKKKKKHDSSHPLPPLAPGLSR